MLHVEQRYRDTMCGVARLHPCKYCYLLFSSHGATAPSGPGTPHYRGFAITLRHTTLGRTPLDEWPARRRDLYLTTYNTQKTETSMPPARFEPAIPASERPQTHALDGAATGIRLCIGYCNKTNKYRKTSNFRNIFILQLTEIFL